MNTMMYHFNYFIILISGIFDSLAIKTKNKYGLSFINDKQPSTTSLNKNAGKYFLKALREKEPKLHIHRSEFAYFINLIYEFRELLIHREMLDMQNFTPNMDEEKHTISAVEINEKTINLT